MQQYLGNRLAIDPELARSFPPAQTLTMTRRSHSSIKIHSVHPPPSIRSILTKAIDGPILVRRRNRTNRPLHWGIIAPPFSPRANRDPTARERPSSGASVCNLQAAVGLNNHIAVVVADPVPDLILPAHLLILRTFMLPGHPIGAQHLRHTFASRARALGENLPRIGKPVRSAVCRRDPQAPG